YHASARTRDTAHLGQPLSQIGEIAQEKSRGDEGKCPGLERQSESVGLHEPDAAARLLGAALGLGDGEHSVGEVGTHDGAVPVNLAQLEGQVPRAGGEIETGSVRRGDGLARRRAAPRVVHPEGHQPVHEVVAPGDTREHLADEARLARSLAQPDAHSMRPPSTAAKRMTAMYPLMLKNAISSRERSSGETSECS